MCRRFIDQSRLSRPLAAGPDDALMSNIIRRAGLIPENGQDWIDGVRGRPRRRELDKLDFALVGALQEDGRTSNIELAAHLGVSEKTVRTRIARLVSEHGLTVKATFGDAVQRSRMVYLLHTEPGRRSEVAESLARMDEVDRVHLVTGAADVIVSAVFVDDNAAIRFLSQTVDCHPGVRAVQSCHLIRDVGSERPGTSGSTPQINREALSTLLIGQHTQWTSQDSSTRSVMPQSTGWAVTGFWYPLRIRLTTRWRSIIPGVFPIGT